MFEDILEKENLFEKVNNPISQKERNSERHNLEVDRF